MSGKGTVYQADQDHIREVLAKINESLDTAAGAYSSMMSDIELVDRAWCGGAHDEYMQKLEKCCEGFKRLIDELHVYADDLQGAAGEFDRAEDEINQIVSALNF